MGLNHRVPLAVTEYSIALARHQVETIAASAVKFADTSWPGPKISALRISSPTISWEQKPKVPVTKVRASVEWQALPSRHPIGQQPVPL